MFYNMLATVVLPTNVRRHLVLSLTCGLRSAVPPSFALLMLMALKICPTVLYPRGIANIYIVREDSLLRLWKP